MILQILLKMLKKKERMKKLLKLLMNISYHAKKTGMLHMLKIYII